MHFYRYLNMSLFLTLDHVYSLYNIDPFEKASGMFIVDQNNHPQQEHSGPKHQFDGLLMAFMMKGSIKTRIHFLEYEINAGDIVIVLPQLMMETQSATEDAEIISIGISLDFITDFPILRDFIMNNEIRRQPIIRLQPEEQELQREFTIFLKKFYHKKPSSKKLVILQHLIIALINMISEAYSSLVYQKKPAKTRALNIIDNLYILVTQYAGQHRNVSFYAEKLHLTPQYLSAILKQNTGKSVLQWIDHIVIMQAKSLLKSTNLSIKEIGNELNFGDSSLFCRYFKRNTGISPKTFRNEG